MIQVALHFALDSAPVSCESYGQGHINRTFLVVTKSGRRYILQGLNARAFHNIEGLMNNVSAVTSYLAAHAEDPRSSMRLVPTKDGQSFWLDENGEAWRVYDYIEGSICLQAPESPEDFYQSAIAFGSFQRALADFPAETLCETIPEFHNTPDRYRKFHAAIETDVCGRVSQVKEEINFYLAREKMGGGLQRMRESGALPLRVTHNDTKLNNVMLDATTRRALCVIDLDTVMPGLVAYDFGDSIRFGAATAPEDEKDLSKMEMDLGLFEVYAKGFLMVCPHLTEAEVESLPLGAKIMTLECGMRFLTDYLEGDRYFSIHRPKHNLDRARTQQKLVEDMEQKWDEMVAIIHRLAKKKE